MSIQRSTILAIIQHHPNNHFLFYFSGNDQCDKYGTGDCKKNKYISSNCNFNLNSELDIKYTSHTCLAVHWSSGSNFDLSNYILYYCIYLCSKVLSYSLWNRENHKDDICQYCPYWNFISNCRFEPVFKIINKIFNAVVFSNYYVFPEFLWKDRTSAVETRLGKMALSEGMEE